MSVLLRRSLLVLGLLFGLLFAVGTAVLWHFNVNIWFGIAFAVVIVGLQYLIGPKIIDWIFRISWIEPLEISPELFKFMTDACAKDKIPMPKLGLIEDGNPNAFTYGHTPKDSRLVVTRGLVEMLNGDELNAVVGHELGHIKHWDFVVMTIASLIPLLLYQIYVWTRYADRKGRNEYAWVIMVTAYVAYILSQYIALFLSRIREYYADAHATEVTGNPRAMATALVKIAYGLAKIAPPENEKDKNGKKSDKPVFDKLGAVSSLSFFGKTGASSFAMAASDLSGNFSVQNMARAMRWDMFNPWAKLFELQCTHPLPAKRIREVLKEGVASGQSSEIPVDPPKESYASKFVADLGVASLPYVGIVFGLIAAGGYVSTVHHLGLAAGGWIVGFYSLGWLFRLMFCYAGEFGTQNVLSLIGETDVSHVRPIPVRMKGKIIGRGIPGLFYSKDFVIQDETGFTTLQYRQPLRILEFLFGAFKAEELVGQEATVYGWYRRAPGPYIEMKQATFANGKTIKCHYRAYAVTMSIIGTVVGLLIGAFGMLSAM